MRHTRRLPAVRIDELSARADEHKATLCRKEVQQWKSPSQGINLWMLIAQNTKAKHKAHTVCLRRSRSWRIVPPRLTALRRPASYRSDVHLLTGISCTGAGGISPLLVGRQRRPRQTQSIGRFIRAQKTPSWRTHRSFPFNNMESRFKNFKNIGSDLVRMNRPYKRNKEFPTIKLVARSTFEQDLNPSYIHKIASVVSPTKTSGCLHRMNVLKDNVVIGNSPGTRSDPFIPSTMLTPPSPPHSTPLKLLQTRGASTPFLETHQRKSSLQ